MLSKHDDVTISPSVASSSLTGYVAFFKVARNKVQGYVEYSRENSQSKHR